MSPLAKTLMAAARADSIPSGSAALWHVKKLKLTRNVLAAKDGKLVEVPAGDYTQLWRWTEETRRNYFPDAPGPTWPGELVMTDSPEELRTHLNFMLRAHGRVLICGLGLGCVIRGCLANPRVQHIVCIERDPEVLQLVKPHMPAERLTILQADALSWVRNNIERQRFDCAWHDLWSDPDKQEPALELNHSELFVRCHGYVGFQGAWAFPRPHKRLWRQSVGNIIA